MKKNKKMSDDTRNAFCERFDALLPSPEDLADDEIESILKNSNLDPTVVLREAHHRLQALAGKHFLSQGKSVPPELKNALQQLRPPSPIEQRRLDAAKARSVIRSIVDNLKEQFSATSPHAQPIALQPAFRNKKELTSRDKELLADLQKELDERKG